jgi:hypothetical protein
MSSSLRALLVCSTILSVPLLTNVVNWFFNNCPASMALGFPTSFVFVSRIIVFCFDHRASCIALGATSVLAYLAIKIISPFDKCPRRMANSFSNLPVFLAIVTAEDNYDDGLSLLSNSPKSYMLIFHFLQIKSF